VAANGQLKFLKVATWNLQRGLVKREAELMDLMKEENIDIMILTEVDINFAKSKDSLNFPSFTTILPKVREESSKVRVMVLLKQELNDYIRVRDDLMTHEIQSIWLEVLQGKKRKKPTLICGLYREWDHEGEKSLESQKNRLQILTEQVDRASEEKKHIVVLGDINLCARKWDDPDVCYRLRCLAEDWKQCLARNGLRLHDVGDTYFSNHASGGEYVQSALDHVYSSGIVQTAGTLSNSSTDHLPVWAVLQCQKPRKVNGER